MSRKDEYHFVSVQVFGERTLISGANSSPEEFAPLISCSSKPVSLK